MELKRLLALSYLGLVAPMVHAVVIVESTATNGVSDPGAYGQVLLTPNDGVADVLESFTWFAPDGSTRVGGGTVYLFGNPYSGTPDALSAASFIAQSAVWSGSEYSFLSSMPVLNPNTAYYVYSDTILNVGYQFDAGPGHFWASSLTSNFDPYNGSTAYRAEGSAVPEPTTLALFGLGLAGIGAMRRRKLAA